MHLFSQSRGKLRCDETLQAFLPGNRPNASGPPAPAAACSDWTPCWTMVTSKARRRRALLGTERLLHAHSLRRPSRRRPAASVGAVAAHTQRACVRRFPERRHRQGPRACDARRLPLDRARQALHHDRHGDRPGQDLEHERARRSSPDALGTPIPEVGLTTFRPPYTPVTFGTLAGTARGRSVRSRAPDADPRLGARAWRGVRGCRPLEARALLPARRRGHARRRRARMPRRCAARSACSMPRRSARSRSSARTPPNSSTACTSTPWTKLDAGPAAATA